MEQLRSSEERQLRDIIPEAMRPARKYQQKIKRKKFKPPNARFKLKFWYLDGYESCHWSYDFFYKYTDGVKDRIEDEENGLLKLIRCVNKFRDKFVTAIIWCTLSETKDTNEANYNHEICKWVRNKKPKSSNLVQFKKGKLQIELLKDRGFNERR